jgi:hypothetical protein
MGTFLWGNHHPKPNWKSVSADSMTAELLLPEGRARRSLQRLQTVDGWRIDDAFDLAEPGSAAELSVFWQFAPGIRLQPAGKGAYSIWCGESTLSVQMDPGWHDVRCWCPEPGERRPAGSRDLRGTCSPAFRRTESAPFLHLQTSLPSPGLLRTSFLAQAKHAP